MLYRLSYSLSPIRDGRGFQPSCGGVLTLRQLQQEVGEGLRYKDLARLTGHGLIRNVQLMPIEYDESLINRGRGRQKAWLMQSEGWMFAEIREPPWYLGITSKGMQFLEGGQLPVMEREELDPDEPYDPLSATTLVG